MKNKRLIKIFVAVLLCAVFFLISHFTTNSLEKGVSVNNVGTIEKMLQNLQNESGEIIARAVSGCSDSVAPNFDSILQKKLHEKGVFIFVTDDVSSNTGNPAERIIYWSDNLPVTVEQLDNVTEESKYMYFGNGWYVAQAFRHGTFKYITLILVAREYLYQNQFLRNEINPAFDFPKNIIILPLGDVGITVKDSAGVPLFVVNSNVPTIVTSGISLLFRWLAVISGCFLILFVFHNRRLYERNFWYLLPAFVLLLGLRIFIFHNLGFFRGDLYLFTPSLYADSEILPSLGDLLLHLLFLFLFVAILFSAKEPLRVKLRNNRILFILSGIVIALFLCATLYITESLAFNSEISFKVYKMNDVTVYTLLAYFILALVFTLLCLLVYLHIFVFENFKSSKQLVIQGVVALLVLCLLMKFKYENLIITILYIAIYFLFSRKARPGFTLSAFVGMTALISLYVSFSLIVNTTEKEHKQREVLAKGLLTESDPTAEMLLKDMEQKISTDPYVKKILCSDLLDNTDLYEVFAAKYFRGYLQRYELIYHVCHPHSILEIKEEDKTENCIEFFMKEKSKGNPLLGSSHFRFMNNYWGRIHYLGDFKFVEGQDTVFLFLELYSKRESESSIGYPELLQFESGGIDYEAKGYSYAKYSDGKRVSKVGNYDYSFELTSRYKDGFFEINGYSHYSFKTKDGNVAILSFPKFGYSGVVSIFSYSFVIFIVMLFILLSVTGLKPEISISRNSYRRRITVVILTGIIGALTILTIAMLAYIISQSEKKNLETIHSKMQSTIIELDQSLFDVKKIVPEMYNSLEATLIVLSNAFNTDLNMYDLSGNLLVSSRNEIFDKKLIGKKMNREALHTLSTEKQSKFIHTERIGRISYFSSYTAYYNRQGEAIAYLNILHFNNQAEFRTELLSLTGAIMNIYIFLIVIGIALAVFVSNQITRPLDLVRRKMAKLNFAEHPEPIDYKGKNELGDLVGVYNRMIAELAESAKIMAENERESAWREMARQIAHEIKNPLTPMKLNIQLALRMKDENRKGWQEKMDAAIKSTLEQIDILSYIASEFSNFARMGKVELEPVDLSQAISSAISLFSGYNGVKISYSDSEKEYWIKANREQLQRVLTNMLKNSMQALENIPNPEIVIVLERKEKHYVISISDNGAGVSDEVAKNLFHPNFTTKSGGTGLGLAISKSIIESFGGTITLIPNTKGACFEISFPKNMMDNV
ncbi:MAG: GHKL domain-containing protein [Prevotellaceae bacterium]|jgi:signal transduction histidine kinase|nr:GHKL domain-containing protein [Prevotellaceae bacterium]